MNGRGNSQEQDQVGENIWEGGGKGEGGRSGMAKTGNMGEIRGAMERGEELEQRREMEAEEKGCRRRCCRSGVGQRWWRIKGDGGGSGGGWSNNGKVIGIGASGGGGIGSGRGGGGGRSLSAIFREQPLQREFTPFFLQITARVCGRGGVPSPLIELKMSREEKMPT